MEWRLCAEICWRLRYRHHLFIWWEQSMLRAHRVHEPRLEKRKSIFFFEWNQWAFTCVPESHDSGSIFVIQQRDAIVPERIDKVSALAEMADCASASSEILAYQCLMPLLKFVFSGRVCSCAKREKTRLQQSRGAHENVSMSNWLRLRRAMHSPERKGIEKCCAKHEEKKEVRCEERAVMDARGSNDSPSSSNGIKEQHARVIFGLHRVE